MSPLIGTKRNGRVSTERVGTGQLGRASTERIGTARVGRVGNPLGRHLLTVCIYYICFQMDLYSHCQYI